jgi:prevent-host-death family protein
MVDLSMSQARVQLDTLVRRAASERERVTITDRGRPAAVLVNAQELADLEEALALAEYRFRQAAGEHFPVPHAEVQQKLGVREIGSRDIGGRGTAPGHTGADRPPA